MFIECFDRVEIFFSPINGIGRSTVMKLSPQLKL